ncbi:MAG: DUF697 domain-containing protein [Desulfobacterales bacterium]|nr:DUF697 domain-containing protein [Desulfobacterales bacterium]
MRRKDSKEKEGRGKGAPPLEDVADSPGSKLRVKRSRRRVYEPVDAGPPSAVLEEGVADSGQEGLQDKIRVAKAQDMVKNHVFGAMGTGLIPIPILDAAAVSGVQLHMLHRLARHYGIPFIETRAKALTASLIGSLGPAVLAGGAFGMLVKALPGIGSILGAVKLSVFSGAATYAVGMVFVQHFESGGTFLDFQPEKVRDYYARQYMKGREAASELSEVR